jgi:hypothetical protein
MIKIFFAPVAALFYIGCRIYFFFLAARLAMAFKLRGLGGFLPLRI